MTDDNDQIYDSAPSEPNDTLWLEQGRDMLKGSIGSVRDAAKSLMTAAGLLNGIYLGILGLAPFVPEDMDLTQKCLFVIPLIFWAGSLYLGLQVLLTKRLDINLRSPDDIRDKHEALLREKQMLLKFAFWLLTAGLVMALWLIVFRPGV
ncbi:MAG: hypothetical protein KKG33_00485 [candidate division Zixibacteria bacterium]|nr:hypothetical protein [candidate division Zixibacteria bacterium]MBU1469878.1 hypothetical protein [candidate division Zixibacteria bacterium]MBU2624016.1 hypothetical protein [candidate division Zixibacteria bacterium]